MVLSDAISRRDPQMPARLTLTRARMIVRCRLAYAPREVREAAVFLLARLDATPEDVHDAGAVIAIGTRDRPDRQFLEAGA